MDLPNFSEIGGPDFEQLRGVSETPIQVRERNGLENHGSGQKWRCTMYYVPPILEVVTCPADRICHVYTHMTCVAKRYIATYAVDRVCSVCVTVL